MTTPTPVSILPISRRDDEPLFEVIDGQQVDLPPSSYHSSRVASHLFGKLVVYNLSQNSGEFVMETLFRLPLMKDCNRRADVAFVSHRRWLKGRPSNRLDVAWPVVPELAVEIVCPIDKAEELMGKVRDYFEAGVELVWIVYPAQGLVTVYESLTKMRVLTSADVLDGGSVLPGFRLPLGAFFAELPVEPIPEEP